MSSNEKQFRQVFENIHYDQEPEMSNTDYSTDSDSSNDDNHNELNNRAKEEKELTAKMKRIAEDLAEERRRNNEMEKEMEELQAFCASYMQNNLAKGRELFPELNRTPQC